MSHIPSIEQKKAFNSAIRALKKCRKIGLVLYGKQENLVGYTLSADLYADKFGFEYALRGDGGMLPHLSCRVLTDSGGDDYARYRTIKDEDTFNPNAD
jgi:hypothetical protein